EVAYTGGTVPKSPHPAFLPGRLRDKKSAGLGHNRHIEVRIVLLHIVSAVLLTELLDNRFHRFGIRNRKGSEFRLLASCINRNLRVLQQILVPLRRRTTDW